LVRTLDRSDSPGPERAPWTGSPRTCGASGRRCVRPLVSRALPGRACSSTTREVEGDRASRYDAAGDEWSSPRADVSWPDSSH